MQPKAEGGDNKLANLRLLHANCHRQLHSKKGKMLK
ncbi:HNH endonuclease [Candidatus Williamhamiltonella defendens]|nr:HNH endonuclease [Candidatus Hamiltonella defensa]